MQLFCKVVENNNKIILGIYNVEIFLLISLVIIKLFIAHFNVKMRNCTKLPDEKIEDFEYGWFYLTSSLLAVALMFLKWPCVSYLLLISMNLWQRSHCSVFMFIPFCAFTLLTKTGENIPLFMVHDRSYCSVSVKFHN